MEAQAPLGRVLHIDIALHNHKLLAQAQLSKNGKPTNLVADAEGRLHSSESPVYAGLMGEGRKENKQRLLDAIKATGNTLKEASENPRVLIHLISHTHTHVGDESSEINSRLQSIARWAKVKSKVFLPGEKEFEQAQIRKPSARSKAREFMKLREGDRQPSETPRARLVTVLDPLSEVVVITDLDAKEAAEKKGIHPEDSGAVKTIPLTPGVRFERVQIVGDRLVAISNDGAVYIRELKEGGKVLTSSNPFPVKASGERGSLGWKRNHIHPVIIGEDYVIRLMSNSPLRTKLEVINLSNGEKRFDVHPAYLDAFTIEGNVLFAVTIDGVQAFDISGQRGCNPDEPLFTVPLHPDASRDSSETVVGVNTRSGLSATWNRLYYVQRVRVGTTDWESRIVAYDIIPPQKMLPTIMKGKQIQAVTADGMYVYGFDDGVIKVWSASDGEPLWNFIVKMRDVATLKCSGKDNLIITDQDGSTINLNLNTGIAGPIQPSPEAKVKEELKAKQAK